MVIIAKFLMAGMLSLGGQGFAGVSVGDGPTHWSCVEYDRLILCADGFTL